MYKYLGITFDDNLSWKCHVNAVVKKVHSRLYCSRKLGSFDVRKEILQMFYTATTSSVLTFGTTYWGGNASKQDKNRLDKNIRKAAGVAGRRQGSINTAYHRLMTNKLKTILADKT